MRNDGLNHVWKRYWYSRGVPCQGCGTPRHVRIIFIYNRGVEGLENHQIEERPWGSFERFTLNEPTTVKIVTVKPGEAISLQTHNDRDEFWRVIQGSGTITLGEEDHAAVVGTSFFCVRGTKHRVTGGPEGLSILEIAFGNFDEGDITRLEDRYGRI